MTARPSSRNWACSLPTTWTKLKNVGNIIPGLLASSKELWEWDGGLYHLPHLWGSEAISWRTDLYKGNPAELSYGSLWADDVKGHVQGRPHSLLLGIGLWMDASGKLPSNRMLDAYKDPDSFKKIYDQLLPFAIEHKPWIKQFWDSADNTKSGLMENDVWIGQTWDGPVLSLKKEGKPVSYQAPKEGAIAWLDGLSLVKAAKNTDQVYALLEYLQTPEVSAAAAEGSGYNPTVTGADALLSPAAKANFQEVLPRRRAGEPLAPPGRAVLVRRAAHAVRGQVQGRLIGVTTLGNQPRIAGAGSFSGNGWPYLNCEGFDRNSGSGRVRRPRIRQQGW